MNILLIAYHYPPLNNGGVQRPLKMRKYLCRFGHEVAVLTHSHRHFGLSEDAEATFRIYDINKTGAHYGYWLPVRVGQKVLTRLGRYRSLHHYWLSSARRHGDAVVRRSNPGLILATFPPHETLELGLHLAERHRLPLITDFRDGLLFEPPETTEATKPHVRAHLERLERAVVRRSAAIITVSEPITQYFRDTYRHGEVHTVFNGFDPEDFAAVPPLALDASKFNLVYTGRLTQSDASVNPAPFFAAVESLVQANGEARRKLRLHFVGQFSREEERLMNKLRAEGVLSVSGAVARERALAYQQAGDALLLITSAHRKSVVTGKLFEYLMANRPILALTHDTAAGRIIEETSSGWIAHPESPQQIQGLLLRMMSGHGPDLADPLRREQIMTYARSAQMKRLSDLIEHVVNSGAEPGVTS